MTEYILCDADLLKPEHQLVIIVIGTYDGAEIGLPEIVSCCAEGIGYGANESGITFWDELDEYEQERNELFEVECYLMDDSCTLTYAELYHYLVVACNRYGERFANARSELQHNLATYRERFL